MDRKIKIYPYIGNYSVKAYIESTLALVCEVAILMCVGTCAAMFMHNLLPQLIAALIVIGLMIRNFISEEPKRKAINQVVVLDNNKHLWIVRVNPEKPKKIIDTRDLEIPDLDRAVEHAKNYIYVRNYINDVVSGRIVNVSPDDQNAYIELSNFKKVSEDDDYIYIEGLAIQSKKMKSKKVYKIRKTYDNLGEIFSGIDPFDPKYK